MIFITSLNSNLEVLNNFVKRFVSPPPAQPFVFPHNQFNMPFPNYGMFRGPTPPVASSPAVNFGPLPQGHRYV